MSSYWNDPFCNKLVLFKLGMVIHVQPVFLIASYSEGILKQVVKGNVTEYLFSQRMSHWHSQTEN